MPTMQSKHINNMQFAWVSRLVQTGERRFFKVPIIWSVSCSLGAVLSACGGGSTTTSFGQGPDIDAIQTLTRVVPPTETTTDQADQQEAPPPQASTAYYTSLLPIHYIDDLVHIGGGVMETILPVGGPVSPYLDIPQATTRHGNTLVWHDQVRNGTDRLRLADYLENTAVNRRNLLHRLVDPPLIRLAYGTSDEHTQDVRFVISILNDSLPRDWQLKRGVDRAPAPVGKQDDPPSGEIIVTFAAWEDWPDHIKTGCGDAVGCADYWPYYLDGELTGGNVWIDHKADANKEAAGRRNVIAHEIIHLLGFDHPDPYLFGDSIMKVPSIENSGFILSQLDRDALFAVYALLESATHQSAIYSRLGPWEDTSDLLYGSLPIPGGDVMFGAVYRNGLIQPWANGPYPSQWLEDNDEISGIARWSGRLLGFTPNAESVAGAANMLVRLDTLAADLDFTSMEKWPEGTAPGRIGTGTRWGDGDLTYTIKVYGNTFQQDWEYGDNDDGDILGSFVGVAHEGMAGTLKRRDLNAAFGGVRQDFPQALPAPPVRDSGAINSLSYGLWNEAGASIPGQPSRYLRADILSRNNEVNPDYFGRNFNSNRSLNLTYQDDNGFVGIYAHEGKTGRITSDVSIKLTINSAGAHVSGFGVGIENSIMVEGQNLGRIEGLAGFADLNSQGVFRDHHDSRVFSNLPYSSGIIEGAFSNINTAQENPRLVAGEVKVRYGNIDNQTKNSLVGVFVAGVEE